MTQTSLRRRWHGLSALEQSAWLLVLVLFVIGDMALTAAGLRLGAVERNHVALGMIETVGLWPAMVIAKSVVLGWTAVCWHVAPLRYRYLFPASVAVLGALVVTINSAVVLMSL